ncbi:hypothetical protein BN1013_01430 [Candidatus Rubidus massiliensis]|nr:MAG: hypothetical protein BGO10_04540 [Chlamydia sp. 32-24]CDZ80903.1 hypothetical protein BN1013_01430 [Candidatus Rubidus massiliensis]
MNPENPFESLYDEANEIMEMIRNNPLSEEEIPPEMYAQLELLQHQLKYLIQANEAALSQKGITKEDLVALEKRSKDHLEPKAKRLIEKGQRIQLQVEQMQRRFENSLKNKEPTSEKSDTQAARVRTRKKKLKQMGGDKGWIKL